MMHWIKSTLAITLVIFLAACTASKKFELLKTDSFSFGKTTYDEILQRFGKPYHEGYVVKNERPLKTISYLKMNAIEDDQAVSTSISPIRVISFYFADNILVGHEFTSSFKKDTTYFDPAKVREIKKGETTLSQMIDLLGSRYGKGIYPLVKNKDEQGIIYVYTQTVNKGSTRKLYYQSLILSVNKQGVVTDFEFASSGQM